MKILIGVFLSAICLTVAYVSLVWLSPHEPTDDELKTRFLNNRDSFTRLEQLFVRNATLLYASPRTLHRDNRGGVVSDSVPTVEYLSAFERARILSGGRTGVLYLEFVEFPAYRVKLDGGDIGQRNYKEKGYAFMLSPPEKVQETLGAGNTYGNLDFKQIEGHWYIYRGIQVSKPE